MISTEFFVVFFSLSRQIPEFHHRFLPDLFHCYLSIILSSGYPE
jgi:hypothetical protein